MTKISFRPGDRLEIGSYTSKPRRRGLSYRPMNVVVDDAGISGGKDVYDGVDDQGNEVSFYGFSVVRLYDVPRGTKRAR